jgi:hypothetical protein
MGQGGLVLVLSNVKPYKAAENENYFRSTKKRPIVCISKYEKTNIAHFPCVLLFTLYRSLEVLDSCDSI